MEGVFSGTYVDAGRLRAVDDLPIGPYRLASDAEIAAGRESELLPPDATDQAPFAQARRVAVLAQITELFWASSEAQKRVR